MFKKAETGLYVTAVIGVIAIFLVTMFAMGGLPWTIDGDLVGDAKAMFVQQNGISPHLLDEVSSKERIVDHKGDSLFARRGVAIEQAPQERLRKGTFEEMPEKGSDSGVPDEIPYEEGGSSSWDGFYNNCMNGLAEGEIYLVGDLGYTVSSTPTSDMCTDYANYMMTQVQGQGSSAECRVFTCSPAREVCFESTGEDLGEGGSCQDDYNSCMTGMGCDY